MLDALQFTVLPFGSALALVVFGWVIWHARRSETRRFVAKVLVAGILGAAVLVVVLHLMLRLPWMFACIDCLERYAWFSYALTCVQGFGVFASLALVVRWFYSRADAGNA